MSQHLSRDLEELKREIMTMGAMVEDATNRAMTALLQRRIELAEAVIAGDKAIDRKENQVEDRALKVLALHQPVATDLRFVVMVLKVNHDLERMGDLAKNLAERTRYLARQEPLPLSLPLAEMSDIVRSMVRRSLDSLVNMDTHLARGVLDSDDMVDDMHRQMYDQLQELMKRMPESVERAVRLLSVSRYLERIADHATNLAEDVVFMVEGEMIRHQVATAEAGSL